MKIGIDLDNTIISYDDAFLNVAKRRDLIDQDFQGGKSEVKQIIKQRKKGEKIWQKLQGQVYGKYIDQANIFPGFKRFHWRCSNQKIPVTIISHKTEYGHYDEEKISLRMSALSFLEQEGIVNKDKNIFPQDVFFTSTREEKIKTIKHNNFDWFIDDLEAVIFDNNLKDLPNKILFSKKTVEQPVDVKFYSSWSEIEYEILGPISETEIKSIASTMFKKNILSSQWVGGRGNSGVYKITLRDESKAALKIYSDNQGHNRLNAEYNGSSLLAEKGVAQIPKPLTCNHDLNCAAFEWIEGELVEYPTEKNLNQSLMLLNQLHNLRHLSAFSSFPRASAACFSGLEIELQLKKRLRKLHEQGEMKGDVKSYIYNELKPFIAEMVIWSKERWSEFDDFERVLTQEELTLSPSDFGFHNALEKDSGEIIFHDLEYFGWDDPVKLIVDFSVHPGMNLDEKLLRKWFQGTLKIYGKKLLPKLLAAWPLYGLCWVLIYLNEFLPDVWRRRILADPSKLNEKELVLEKQLSASKKLLNVIKNNYERNSIIGASETYV